LLDENQQKAGNKMTDLRIYRLAMNQLLTNRKTEEKRLLENPKNLITIDRLEKIDADIEYLHELIYDLEQTADSKY